MTSAWIWHQRSEIAPPPKMRIGSSRRLANSRPPRAASGCCRRRPRARRGPGRRCRSSTREVVPAAAGVAVVDRGALAREPGREHHAAAARRRALGRARSGARSSPARPTVNAVAQPAQAEPGGLVVVGDEVARRVQPGNGRDRVRARRSSCAGTGSEIHEVVLIVMCGWPSPIAPQPSAAECRSGRARDHLRARAEAELGGDLRADRADHRAGLRPAAAAWRRRARACRRASGRSPAGRGAGCRSARRRSSRRGSPPPVR